jgi:hypothetical protein
VGNAAGCLVDIHLNALTTKSRGLAYCSSAECGRARLFDLCVYLFPRILSTWTRLDLTVGTHKPEREVQMAHVCSSHFFRPFYLRDFYFVFMFSLFIFIYHHLSSFLFLNSILSFLPFLS